MTRKSQERGKKMEKQYVIKYTDGSYYVRTCFKGIIYESTTELEKAKVFNDIEEVKKEIEINEIEHCEIVEMKGIK